LLSLKFAANSEYNKEIEANPDLLPAYTEIRKKAVTYLRKREEKNKEEFKKEFRLILLQLVQAFRYENFKESELRNLFFEQVFNSLDLANDFHWLIHLEKENSTNNNEIILHEYQDLYDEFMGFLQSNYEDYYNNI
jgi:hypothetical protein